MAVRTGGVRPPVFFLALAVRRKAGYSIRTMWVLVLSLKDSESLERLHGPAVVESAQQDVARSFRDIASHLLQQHELLTGILSPGFGTWLVPFRMLDLELEIDPQEQASSIAYAGQELVRKMLQDLFGIATGTRMSFKLAVLETWDSLLDPGSLLEEVREGLESQPFASQAPPKVTREQLEELIHARRIDLHLQTIVSLKDRRVVGCEALARGPLGSPVREAVDLFAAASAHGLQEELELACVAAALEWAPRLPSGLWMSVNIGPELIAKATVHDMVALQVPALVGAEVFELTEHLPVESSLRLHQAVEPLRSLGVRLALDDAGSGFFNMGMVRAMRPDIVKLCYAIISRIGRHPEAEARIVDMIRKLGLCGCEILGEGIETEHQARVLKDAGVTLGQGFLFSRPRPAAEVVVELSGA